MMVWKMFYLLQGCILRFHGNLPGGMVCIICVVMLSFFRLERLLMAEILLPMNTYEKHGISSISTG